MDEKVAWGHSAVAVRSGRAVCVLLASGGCVGRGRGLCRLQALQRLLRPRLQSRRQLGMEWMPATRCQGCQQSQRTSMPALHDGSATQQRRTRCAWADCRVAARAAACGEVVPRGLGTPCCMPATGSGTVRWGAGNAKAWAKGRLSVLAPSAAAVAVCRPGGGSGDAAPPLRNMPGALSQEPVRLPVRGAGLARRA